MSETVCVCGCECIIIEGNLVLGAVYSNGRGSSPGTVYSNGWGSRPGGGGAVYSDGRGSGPGGAVYNNGRILVLRLIQ